MCAKVVHGATIARMGKPPCEGLPGFTDPTSVTIGNISTCKQCPLRRQCASDALTAGATLDRSHVGPADGVLAAGILCTGDQHTASQLARIAGVPTPLVQVRQPRFKRPDRCRHCHRPMTVRKEGQPTTGDQPVHTAHGYCRDCYKRLRKHGALETRAHTTRDLLERTA